MSGQRRSQRLALVLLSAALALALGEGIVRIAVPQSLRPPWDDEVGGVRSAVPSMRGRHMVPGAFDVTVSINRQRFRGTREHAPEPAPDVTRIAMLGDSLTFGWGAADDETYPAQLERLLADGSSARFEVMNSSFPATCLGEKALWYELGVRTLRPHVVILTLVGDDVDGDLFWRVFSLDAHGQAVTARSTGPGSVRATRRFFRDVPGYAFLAQHSQLFGLFRRAVTRVVSRERTTALGQAPAAPEDVRRFREDGLPLAVAEARWLNGRVRESGARLAIVVAPFRESVYPADGWWADELRWKSKALSEAVAAAAMEDGIPFLDATDALRERARFSSAPLFYDGPDTHPTPHGYRALAEAVARWLREAGLVSTH